MGFNEFMSKLFGNKSQRDLKEVKPFVDKIKVAYGEIERLSDDDLRGRTAILRQKIQDYVKDERAEIDKLKVEVEGKDLDEREEIWAKVDKLEKEILDKMEVVLDEILPEAFAIIKDTARRFAQNETIRVKATDLDRDLAINHDFVSIEGDTAVYQNHWVAGGNEILWDMIHYDVQLIGGTVLHKGKIAEMATGEGKTLVATLPVFLNALTGNGVHVVTVNDYLSKRDSEWMGPLYMFHGLTVDCIDKHQPNSDARRKAYNADITFGTNNEFGFDYLRDNMATSPKDLVQRKHNYAIVDEVDSVLIDDARTPLIISGPTPKGEDQLFEEFLPNVEKVVEAQRKLCSQLLIDAKNKMASEDKKEQEEGSLLLYRSFKGLPKNKQLIKYLSEPGIKSSMLKTEEAYMAENMRNMHLVTDELYFIIDEKRNSVELTEKGIDLLTSRTDDPKFFVLPDIAAELSALDNMESDAEKRREAKDEIIANYSIKSERVHTVNQLLKAYALFEKDDQYVVMDNKVLIVDEQTGRIMDGRRYSDGLHQAIEAKEHVKVEAATQTFATITLQNYFRMYHKLAGMTGTAETEAGELWDIYKLDVVVIPTNKPIARKDMNDRIYKTAREKYAAVIEEIVRLVEEGRPVLVGTTSVEISELLSRMLRLRGIQHNVLNAKLHQKEAEIVAQAGQKGTVTIATNMAGRGTDIKLGEGVRELGGLCVIGTERHESRRIDNQLRGRSGRQGDPGESQFYLSLEDDLMKRFGSERLKGVFERLNMSDEAIESRMLTRQVEAAQKRVEGNNYDTRKQVLQYDDVMREQREIIYAQRYDVITADRDLAPEIHAMIRRTIGRIVDAHARSKEDEKLEAILNFAKYNLLPEDSISRSDLAGLSDQAIKDELFQRALKVYDSQVAKLRDEDAVKEFQKVLILRVVDNKWTDHIDALDQLRNAVGLRGYAQNNPVVEYQAEGFRMFNDMIGSIEFDVTRLMMKAQIHEQERPQTEHNISTTATRNIAAQQANLPEDLDLSQIGRNDQCPCGSGKKFKNCHGKRQ